MKNKKLLGELELWNTNSNSNTTTLGSIHNRWKEITGKPDSSSWLWEQRKHAVYKKDYWTTPFKTLLNLDFKHIAQLKKEGKIGDIFMFVKDPEEKRAVAKFLAGKGVDKDTLETLFSPDVLANPPLDQNEEPEPARERDWDLNKRPRLELDLNKSPPRELDEAGDDGGE